MKNLINISFLVAITFVFFACKKEHIVPLHQCDTSENIEALNRNFDDSNIINIDSDGDGITDPDEEEDFDDGKDTITDPDEEEDFDDSSGKNK